MLYRIAVRCSYKALTAITESSTRYNCNLFRIQKFFAEFFACKANGSTPGSPKAQALVIKLQSHITANYYTCTDEILAGLGKMYVADERFKRNIDKYGEGTASFVAESIEIYVEKK